MELSELQEIQEIEQENCQNIFDKFIKDFKSKENISLDVLPEFKKYKKETITNSLHDNIIVQLPFYDKIVLDIPPYTHPTLFELTGFTMDEVFELIEKRKVIPILTKFPTDYTNLDFIDPIIDFIIGNELPISKELRSNILLNMRRHAQNLTLEDYLIWCEFGKSKIDDKAIKTLKQDKFYRILKRRIGTHQMNSKE